MIKGVLLDISGVLTEAGAALPGAVEAVHRLRQAGLPIRFLTNTTRRPKRQVVEEIDALGFDARPDEIYTPVAAAIDWLAANGRRPHLLVHANLEEDFADCAGEGPEAVIIGDAAEGFTYEKMNAAFRALIDGAPLLALAANRLFKDRDGKLSLDAGPFVHALSFATGAEALLFGKPTETFFHATVDSMGCAPSETVMVGDDAENDVAGALCAGIGAALLVRTGKYRGGDEVHFAPCPTAVVADIAAAVDWILAAR